jgi:phosphomannomutase
MGYEEALGYTVGSLVRDKDGVSAAVALADLARWNRARGRTIAAHLDDIYRRVGLFLTQSVSWNLPGAAGLATIRDAMARFRAAPPSALAGVAVTRTRDLATPGEHGLPTSDVLTYWLADGSRVIMRPSGTEPKLKSYYEVRVTIGDGESTAAATARGQTALAALQAAHQALLRR